MTAFIVELKLKDDVEEKQFNSSVMEEFAGVVVRVKRRREEGPGAPRTLVLPHAKRPRNQVQADVVLSSALAALKVSELKQQDQDAPTALAQSAMSAKSDESGTKKRALICTLLDGSKQEDEHVVKKRKQAQEKNFLKVVNLQMEGKKLRQRAVTSFSSKKDVSLINEEMDYAIWYAWNSGHFMLIDLALDAGKGSINYQRHADGLSPLMVACRCCDKEHIESFLAKGANPALLTWSGSDAASFLLDSPHGMSQPDLKEDLLALLGEGDFVYDTYIIENEVEIDDFGKPEVQDRGIWRDAGVSNTWESGYVIADFGIDSQFLAEASWGENDDAKDDLINEIASEAKTSELDDSNDENYRFNDYPDEEDEEDADDERFEGEDDFDLERELFED